MTKEWLKEIPNWEEDYKKLMKEESRLITKRQLELLDGADILSHEGMVYGGMYADWKRKRGFE